MECEFECNCIAALNTLEIMLLLLTFVQVQHSNGQFLRPLCLRTGNQESDYQREVHWPSRGELHAVLN